MPLIEPVEPRRPLAATLAGDPSFGTNGHAPTLRRPVP